MDSIAREGDEDGTPSKRKAEASSTMSEFRTVLQLGWQQSVNMVLTFIPGLAMLYFLNSNPDHVAGAGMGFMFSNVAGYSLIIGSGAGAQPLISQAFGARNFQRCGDLLQRQFAIHGVCIVLIALIWWYTESILVFFKQPSGISALAGQFTRWRVAALPALAIKEDISNYLVAQRIVQLPMLTSIAASLINIICFAVLIPYVGFIGAPLGYTLANIVQAIALWMYTRRVLPDVEAWPKWAWATAFAGWAEMLKLALPGGLLMLCEWWGWETNLFFAGLLCDSESGGGCAQLDAFPIVANTMVIGFMPNFGFSTAAAAMIGNALGANDPAKARRLARIALCIAACVGGIVAASFTLARHRWALFFSTDPEVVDLTVRTIPVVAIYIFLDNVGPGALVSIFRSMNVVILPAIVNSIAFYAMGIPFGVWLTFKRATDDWGIIGLWTGLSVGMFIMVSSLGMFLCVFVNWQQVADAAQAKACGETKIKQKAVEIEKASLKVHAEPDRNVLGKTRYEEVSTDVQI